MNKLFMLVAVFCTAVLCYSQRVFFTEMKQVHENGDKIFYAVPAGNEMGRYLGELEVQGFSNDDVEVFSKVYKKAKEVGANAFSIKPIVGIDGNVQKFDPYLYRLRLYYINSAEMQFNENTAVILGSPVKETRVKINSKSVVLPARSFIKVSLSEGAKYRIGSGKLLGSSIELLGKTGQPAQYFQMDGFAVRGNNQGFLNIKSGDIIMLERSYGEFLTAIYQQISF